MRHLAVFLLGSVALVTLFLIPCIYNKNVFKAERRKFYEVYNEYQPYIVFCIVFIDDYKRQNDIVVCIVCLKFDWCRNFRQDLLRLCMSYEHIDDSCRMVVKKT